MATQSLYRRYRPRRFGEVKGQDHVVRALRNAVAEGREGQAYLFSGPRGTGKTTSARILAKVLNCTNPQDGEPCCECDSCLAVERGTSYDVHELDAASNNGVDAMRDLIEKASLGTPGRHKVYILDEVHMLSKAAEAALLKTLEEPPPHVVFVLATTDPQKMSDTIRSRTQHLQFHLLPADTLQEHVRWVAADAGLTVSDAAIEQVLDQGGGSARDTLSALELVANTGGDGAETVPLGEFVEAMIERDAGRALAMTARAVGLGRDPRTLTEELVGYLRNGFLSIMAPELVRLPAQRVDTLAAQAIRLGPAGLVRGIERLGDALSDMRHAPDPRVLLDVAIVRLTSDAANDDVGALTARVAKLEQQLAQSVPVAPVAARDGAARDDAARDDAARDGTARDGAARDGAAAAAAPSAPVDPATGRAALGGRARRPEQPASSRPDVPVAADLPVADPSMPDATHIAAASDPTPTAAREVADTAPADAAPADTSAETVAGGTVAGGTAMHRGVWDDTVRPNLRGMARAVYSPAEFVSCTASSLTLSLPNAVHRDKCEQHRSVVETSLREAVGAAVALELVLQGGDGGPPASPRPDGGGGTVVTPSVAGPSADGPTTARPGDASAGSASVGSATAGAVAAVETAPVDTQPVDTQPADAAPLDAAPAVHTSPVSGAGGVHGASVDAAVGSAGPGDDARPESPRRAAERRLAEAAAAGVSVVDELETMSAVSLDELPDDDEVDLDDLVDAPPESVKTPIDRLAEAFPGSELLEESY